MLKQQAEQAVTIVRGFTSSLSSGSPGHAVCGGDEGGEGGDKCFRQFFLEE